VGGVCPAIALISVIDTLFTHGQLEQTRSAREYIVVVVKSSLLDIPLTPSSFVFASFELSHPLSRYLKKSLANPFFPLMAIAAG